jgi:NADP-dependent 3-hydroxy acid dehydrogenase YdfG
MWRSIVITGASSGIGEALALRYARDGATLGLIGRNMERLEGVAVQCRGLGAEVWIARIDVRARAELMSWLEEFDRAAPIDLLIANAGVMEGTPPGGMIEPPNAAYALIETNVLGVLNTVQPLIPRMMARGRGQIAIVSSIAGFIPLPDAPSYCASKSWRGINKNRALIAFPFFFALITRLGGLLPDYLRRWTMRPFRFTVSGPD